MGQGDIDWAGIFALAGKTTGWVEFHRGQFAMPAFDPQWLKRQPDLGLNEYSAIIGTAHRRALRDAIEAVRNGGIVNGGIVLPEASQPGAVFVGLSVALSGLLKTIANGRQ